MPTVIRKNKRDRWGDAFGIVGQGLSGFANGYMGGQQLDLAKQNAEDTRNWMEKLFGGPGAINGMSEQGRALDTAFNQSVANLVAQNEGAGLAGPEQNPATPQSLSGGGAAPAVVTGADLGIDWLQGVGGKKKNGFGGQSGPWAR